MEERIGILWHRLAGHLANKSFSNATVELSSISHNLAIIFRAMGGDHAIKLQAGEKIKHGSRRTIIQRLAGTQLKAETAWVDNEALRLPQLLNIYPDKRLNRNLYTWITVLCAHNLTNSENWFQKNQAMTLQVIHRFPGLEKLYQELVEAEILRRPQLNRLVRDEATQERAIRNALRQPGSEAVLPHASRPPIPVPLWVRSSTNPTTPSSTSAQNQQTSTQNQNPTQNDTRRRTAEHAELPARGNPMLLFRPETILSLTEFAKTEHETSENDSDSLCQFADDLDIISIARDDNNIAKKLRMDLDMAHADNDDAVLQDGKLLPEWNYITGELTPDQCRTKLVPVMTNEAANGEIPEHLKRTLRKLKNSFSMLNPHRIQLKSQPYGNDIDIDEYIKFHSARNTTNPCLYLDYRKRERDISSLLLSDISLSTEAWIGNKKRVIDIIRESMHIFSSSLAESNDPFSLYGFNSKHRTDVRLYEIKSFNERYTETIQRRINSIEPAAYTRMGAAIRHATEILSQQPSRDRLLILLTDGKPNDADHYEGRYGIEDTRMSLIEAKKQGMHVFCVTIDQEAHEYMPYIFGKNNFTVIRNPAELPTRLTLLYRQITQR